LWSSLRPGGVSPVVHGYKSEQKSSILHRLFKIVAAINFCFYSTHRARGRKCGEIIGGSQSVNIQYR
jgi:hypothetical protein